MSEEAMKPKERIAKIALDEGTIIRRTPEIDHERAIALSDLLDTNTFAPVGLDAGPYDVLLSVSDNRLNIIIKDMSEAELSRVALPLAPFRSIIKDYFIICGSYFDAIKQGSILRIESIDMARRGLHNEGSELLSNLLKDRIVLDFETSRRLFTLVCVLHIK
ncbi:MAG: UPF0262 family protein [Alphaproteobacteria bacterium]|nr:UPF0262 family protein [Alphaproteobacteria bacterium]